MKIKINGSVIAASSDYADKNVKSACGGRKAIKSAVDGKLPYDLVSMLVVLRDYVDTSSAYVSDEHNKLVDIADSMYNAGLNIDEMRPEYKSVYEKYGRKFFDTVLKDASAIDSQLTRNNLNDLIADYEDRANAFIGVEGACGSKKSVKAAEQDGNKKFRIDVYKKGNPDALIKREYKTCNSKEEAQKYGQSIADGNTVNVMEVKSSCSKRKSVRAAAVMAGPGAGYTIKWNLESINNINSFNVTNVSEPDEYGLITVEADCDVDVTVEIVEAYSYYYGIDRPINGVPAKMTKVSFEIDPDQWPELGSFYDAGVDFAAEFLNNEIYDTISNGEVMYGGGWSHSTWDGTLTDYEHDGLIEIKVTDEETIEYVDDAVSGAFEYDNEYDAVEESKRNNSVKTKRSRITAAEGSFEANVEKIKYYASKVMEDINAASQIFQNSGESWTPIEVPDVPVEDDGQLFYEWYVQDYVDLFDGNHPDGGEIIQSYNRRGSEFNVSYGYFNSKDLYNYGDDVESLMEFVEGANYMEDLYWVTFENGCTIQDLATDPYKVFNNYDDEDKLYYSEEVLAEFDLWTQSDRQYDLAKDAQGIVNLYKEVSDYFSYDNAE